MQAEATRSPTNYILSVTTSGFVLAGFQMVDDAWEFAELKGREGLTLEHDGREAPMAQFPSADDLLLWAARVGAI